MKNLDKISKDLIPKFNPQKMIMMATGTVINELNNSLYDKTVKFNQNAVSQAFHRYQSIPVEHAYYHQVREMALS